MSVKTVRELIDYLEEIAEDHGDDTVVRVAFQPSYPLAAHLACVTAIEGDESNPTAKPVVWLAATSGVDYDERPYAPADAWGNQ